MQKLFQAIFTFIVAGICAAVGFFIGAVSVVPVKYGIKECYYAKPDQPKSSLRPIIQLDFHPDYDLLACKKKAPEGASD